MATMASNQQTNIFLCKKIKKNNQRLCREDKTKIHEAVKFSQNLIKQKEMFLRKTRNCSTNLEHFHVEYWREMRLEMLNPHCDSQEAVEMHTRNG